MTEEDHAQFGACLDAWIKESGLPKREVARRAGVADATVRAYIRGYIERSGVRVAVPPTVQTTIRLADALGLNRAEVLAAAGLEASAHVLARQPRQGEMTTAELLDLLRERLEGSGPAAGQRFDPAQRLSNDQVRVRGTIIAALKLAAQDARNGGDDEAADAICDLIDDMTDQLHAQ